MRSRQASATSRWIVVNSNDSAGGGLGQARQHVGFEAFDVDLQEGRHPVVGDQRVERRHRHLDLAIPYLPFPATGAVRRLDEIAATPS